MKPYVEVLSTPSADCSGTTLLLHFDSKRYIFGRIPEGTQRQLGEYGIKTHKLSDLFLTGRTDWSTLGGLIGMVLTVADQRLGGIESTVANARRTGEPADVRALGMKLREKTGLNIVGGRNLTHFLATVRRFVIRKSLPLHVNELFEPGLAFAQHSMGPKVLKMEADTTPSSALAETCKTLAADTPVSVSARPTTAEDGDIDAADAIRPIFNDQNVTVWAMSILPSSHLKSHHNDATMQSPTRKRTLDGRSGDAPDLAALRALEDDRERNQQIRHAIVSEMFDGDGHLDSLVEMPLREAPTSATIYLRNSQTGRLELLPKELQRSPRGNLARPADIATDVKVLVRRHWPGIMTVDLPQTKPAPETLCYIIKNQYQRGKFLPAQAKKLGLEAGPKYAALARGEEVYTSKGKRITSDMVLEPGKPGGGLAIVDLPTVDYVEHLVSREEWGRSELMEGVGAIFWILGAGVTADERWRAFVRKMAHLYHIVSSVDHCPNRLSLDSVSAAAVRLHQVDPVRFSVPIHDNVTVPQLIGVTSSIGLAIPESPATVSPCNFSAARRGTQIHLEPRVTVAQRPVEPLNTAKVLANTSEDILREARIARNLLSSPKVAARLQKDSENLPNGDAEIITLGTGSAMPSKYRNVSATLLRVPGQGSYLFDCGEGTLGQLRRLYSPNELDGVLRDLRAIWISHMHADHHLGTAAVIKARSVVDRGFDRDPHKPAPALLDPSSPSFDPYPILRNENRLMVIGGPLMMAWLREYASMEDYGYDRIIPLAVGPDTNWSGPGDDAEVFPAQLTWYGHTKHTPAHRAAYLAALRLSDLRSVMVTHCPGARAVTMSFPSGFKVSYSGDCRPSERFARAGRGSTVLIHEATFDEELADDAMAKNHSTIREAIEVGVLMEAKCLMLTHFSQRYQKLPVLDEMQMGGPKRARQDSKSFPGEKEAEAHVDESNVSTDTMIGDPPQNVGPGPWTQTNFQDPKLKKAREDMRIGVAFDHMRVKVRDFAELEFFVPALKKLYASVD